MPHNSSTRKKNYKLKFEEKKIKEDSRGKTKKQNCENQTTHNENNIE